jgi:hypothetical protein
MLTFSQSYHYAVADARTQEAKHALRDLPGDVGHLVRQLAAYNEGKHDGARSDALSTVVFGYIFVRLVEDLPCSGEPPAAWQEAYTPYLEACSQIQACDDAFLALWKRACSKTLSDAADDAEARRLVAQIEAQRDAVLRPVGDLQRLHLQLLPEALASWLPVMQSDQAKLPALAKAREMAEEKAERARNAERVVESHLSQAKQTIRALGQAMLASPEHADKHAMLHQLLSGVASGRPLPPATVHALAMPSEAPIAPEDEEEDELQPIEHVESPW